MQSVVPKMMTKQQGQQNKKSRFPFGNKQQQQHRIWYSRGELNLIIQQARNMIRGFEASCGGGDGGDCYRFLLSSNDDIRGLEHGTDLGYDRSRRRKHSVIQSVLNEQERQKTLEIHDLNALRDVCLSVSTRCVQDAIDMALIDSMMVVIVEQEEEEVEKSGAAATGSDNDDETTTNASSTCWLFSPPVTWFGKNNHHKKSSLLYSKLKPSSCSCGPESNINTTTTIRVLWGQSRIDQHHRRLTRF
eukprot:scaffold9279_cov68-Cylindrotheca_fusiformis.AAC.5